MQASARQKEPDFGSLCAWGMDVVLCAEMTMQRKRSDYGVNKRRLSIDADSGN